MRTTNIVQKSQSSREVSENAIAMSIDEASTVFLMDALGKLYSRPAQAALREYLSNAIDAHKAKGGKLPAIQISLPDGRSNKLFIRDFGKGMNEEEFSTILSRYGASTKRDSNAMIGGFGLGAKSGFALSDEFFMTSYQKGRGIRVRIFKDALNQGYIDVIDRFTTKEPDGVLVELPIPSGNLYELSKKSLFTDFPFFTGYGVDAIDIVPASSEFANQSVHNTKVFQSLDFGGVNLGWLANKTYAGSSEMYALIGKVAYSIDLSKFSSLSKQSKAVDKDLIEAVNTLKSFRRVKVIDIPIGSVDLPSSREEITYSERSIRTIGALISNYALLMKQSIQKELNSKKTKLQVMIFISELEESGYKGVADLTWKGKLVGTDMFKASAAVFSTLTYSSYSGTSSINNIEAKKLKNIRDLSNRSVKSNFKKGLYRITVKTRNDVAAAKKLMTAAAALDFLKIDTTGRRSTYSSETTDAQFVIIPKDDVLNEWLFNYTEMQISELEAVVQRQKLEKLAKEQKIEEERLKKEKAREKAEKAKATRAQTMLSNFIVNSGSAQSLMCNTVETVFKDGKVKKFYWSEEEVTKFASASRATIKLSEGNTRFPFQAKSTANTYNVTNATNAFKRTNYLVQLRSFLQTFFTEGTKIIVIGKERNLEDFKTEYPDVESGVLFVKEAIKAQLSDENSAIMIAYNATGRSRYKNRDEISNLLTFVEALSEENKAKLSSEILSAAQRFNMVRSSTKNLNGLDEKYFLEMLKGFVTWETIEENIYSVEDDVIAMQKKYPLLLNASFNAISEPVISDMLDYIQRCESRA